MKRATPETFNPKARRIDESAHCPECGERSQVFEDGSVCCIEQGGVSFVPEAMDAILYGMRTAYMDKKTGSH